VRWLHGHSGGGNASGQRAGQRGKSRHPPPTQEEVENKKRIIIEEVNSKMPLDRLATLDEEEAERWRRKREQEINKRLGQRVYAWKRIEYGPYESIVYAIARGAQEYAVMKRVLTELSQRDEQFRPRSFFDFGSGIGTGMWVASELWRDHIFEYYNVDRSREMNEISELILRDGHENKQVSLRNVFYRQFLPAIETNYDLVIISHTLFELVDKEQREDVLRNLWRKCDGYMVIVEEGTRRGSELVNEANPAIRRPRRRRSRTRRGSSLRRSTRRCRWIAWPRWTRRRRSAGGASVNRRSTSGSVSASTPGSELSTVHMSPSFMP